MTNSSALKKQTITIQFQNPFEMFATAAEKITTMFSSVINDFGQSEFTQVKKSIFPKLSFSPKFKLPNINKKNILRAVVPVIVVLIFVGVLIKAVAKNPTSQIQGVNVESSKVEKTMKINREFKFPLRDGKGKVVSQFSYTIESAELRHEIVVKGQKASAVPGRVFFIINLKLVNTLKSGLQINSRDYVRVILNGKSELFAADIHNDPVEVQAISTKNTRIGLAINEKDFDIKLSVGEIDGPKEIIPISF